MFRIAAARSLRPTVPRLAHAQTAARRFASSEGSNHLEQKKEKEEVVVKAEAKEEVVAAKAEEKEEEWVFEEENFGSPLWKYALGVIGFLYLLGQYDDYVERSGRVHPMTKFYSKIMSNIDEDREFFREHLKKVARQAEFNMLQWEEKRDLKSTLDSAVYFKRTAEWGTPVGSSVNVSVLKTPTTPPVKE
ncbi:hypothetical protein EV175_002682 [Coemansia sp. RSA 1933]|nr:hypothetical protein EV175_002682 [Coemansia sp. RSA 1933]